MLRSRGDGGAGFEPGGGATRGSGEVRAHWGRRPVAGIRASIWTHRRSTVPEAPAERGGRFTIWRITTSFASTTSPTERPRVAALGDGSYPRSWYVAGPCPLGERHTAHRSRHAHDVYGPRVPRGQVLERQSRLLPLEPDLVEWARFRSGDARPPQVHPRVNSLSASDCRHWVGDALKVPRSTRTTG